MTTTHLRNGLFRLRPLPPTYQRPFGVQRITRGSTTTNIEIIRSSSSLPPLSILPINTHHSRTNHHHHQQPHNRSLSTSNRRPKQKQQQQPYRRRSPHPTFYGTKTIVRASPRPHPPNHPLSPYVATCLRHHLPPTTDHNPSSSKKSSNKSAVPDSDTSFNVLFLGTGAGGRPNTFRSLSSTALRLGGRTFLFDCGEGVQRQMAFGSFGPGEVEKVFVTHLHGDHVSGLLGLVCSIMIARTSAREAERGKGGRRRSGRDGRDGGGGGDRDSKQAPLEIYGPPGLYNYLAMNLTLTCTALHIDIIVYELVGGNDEEGPYSSKANQNQQRQPGRGRNGRFNVWTGRYPEFDHPRLFRKTVPRDSNGRWTLFDNSHSHNHNHNDPKNNNNTPSRDTYNRALRYHIEAGELRHRPGVQTFGYVVREPQPQPPIDVDKCRTVGLKPGPKLRLLKAGQSVRNDEPPIAVADPNNNDGQHTKKEEGGVEYDAEGYRIVHPHEVLVEGEVRPSRGRSFGLVADTFRLSEGMKELVKDVDVLVHEATIREEDCVDRSRSIERGHSTPSMAGAVARTANAKVLLLNHIAGSIDDFSESDQHSSLIKHAQRSNGGVSQVAVAYDFMEFRVPRRGYDFEFEDAK